MRSRESLTGTCRVQAISTHSSVRRRMVLNLCAVIVFTIFAEFEIMLIQPFCARMRDKSLQDVHAHAFENRHAGGFQSWGA